MIKQKLYYLYWEKNLSTYKIAEIYNTSAANIYYWLKKYKINTRHLKGNHSCNFKGGKKRFPKCIDCSKRLTRMDAKRCKKCDLNFRIGPNGRNFQNKKYLCLDCKTELSRKGVERCWRCLLKDKINHPEKHYNWQNGKTFEEYPREFNNELKGQIRKRDNYVCQNCNMTQEEHLIVIGRVLDVHHIDYNKKNCNENNLISLCLSCNTRANFNRDYWIEFYNNKIKQLLKEDF